MMMVQYLLDSDQEAGVPAVAAPRNDFSELVEPVRLALEQERRVSDQVATLTALARAEGDYQAEQFMQWFLKEQVEEVASMTALLRTMERAGPDILEVEEYVLRQTAEAADPTAPRAAGGAL